MDDVYGRELVRSVREGKKFEGTNIVKCVHLSCYAASVIFTNDSSMLDEQSFDRGLLFNIFAALLEDKDFSLEITINAPSSYAVQDAIDYDKLGNSALEESPEAVFLGSYGNIQELIEKDPIFQRAYRTKQFRFMVTEKALPYAIFNVQYKAGYEEYDYVKIDLYSVGILSSLERRSMFVFADKDMENYSFFVEEYKKIRDVRKSKELINKYHDEWIEKWKNLKEQIYFEK